MAGKGMLVQHQMTKTSPQLSYGCYKENQNLISFYFTHYLTFTSRHPLYNLDSTEVMMSKLHDAISFSNHGTA